MNNLFYNLEEKSKKLSNMIKIGTTQFLLYGSLKSDYSKVDESGIDVDLYKILNQQSIQPFIDKIENSNKDIVCITYDSNDGKSNHAKHVKGIIDSNLYHNNLLDQVDSIYIPTTTSSLFKELESNSHLIYNKNYSIQENVSLELKEDRIKALLNEELTFNEVLTEISKRNIDKKIIINRSNGESLELLQESILNLSFLDKEPILDYTFRSIKDSRYFVNLLNENENINVSLTAGNNQCYYHKTINDWQLHDELNNYFFEITKGDFQEMKELSTYLNLMIENKLIHSIENTQLLEKLQEENPNLDINLFFSYYIKDYILHSNVYQTLKQSDNIKNNNIHIIETYDYTTFKKNYDLYKKYNPNIKELDQLFDNLSLKQKNEIVGYDKKNIELLKEAFDNYKEKYPSIFKISKYGCFCNLEFEHSKSLVLSPHGHYKENIGKMNGTSFASPEFVSNYIKDILETNNKDLTFS